MNVRPLRDRVLVERIEEQEQKVGGIYIPDSAREKPQQGTVIAVGNGRVTEKGADYPARYQGWREDSLREVLRHGNQNRRQGVLDHP